MKYRNFLREISVSKEIYELIIWLQSCCLGLTLTGATGMPMMITCRIPTTMVEWLILG